MTRAVVFAYHDVGVRCLKTLLAADVDVALVVTHEDAPGETIWFDSVRTLAAERGIATITPEDPNADDVVANVREARPDFLFSFYYRRMLGAPLLALAPRGGWNVHGSLLPRYRGRVPLNWAILRGETETGATLHRMTAQADAGAIADQLAVPILPDDDARALFTKICVAAEIVLWRSLPALLDGSIELREQDLAAGSYHGARTAEDGRIDPALPARALHDLVRAVSRPFPGAFVDLPQGRLVVWRTAHADGTPPAKPSLHEANRSSAELCLVDGELSILCADGRRLRVLDAQLDGAPLDAARFRAELGERLVLPPHSHHRSAAGEPE